MGITQERVREIFTGLEEGDVPGFFEHVADDVDWTVIGIHPLAGHYLSKKSFIDGVIARVGQVQLRGAQIQVEHLLVNDDEAAIEILALVTSRTGMRFEIRHCWITYFQGGVIVRVRAYLDSAMVARLFEDVKDFNV